MDPFSRSARHLALTACLLTAFTSPATALAEEEHNPLRFYESDSGKSYLQATLNFDLAFFSQDNVSA